MKSLCLKNSGLLILGGMSNRISVIWSMITQHSKYVYLVIFILSLVLLGFGLIFLSPNVLSVLLGVGYAAFFIASKVTSYFNKEWFVIRYEIAFALCIIIIIVITQLTINDAVRSLPIILMFLLFLIIAYLIFSWVYEKIKIIRGLKNEQVHSELALLRSQINPHFFFNTLNNLYGLAIEKSEETPKTILKLSEMMRYTIYDGKKERVSITQEIQFLKNYIDLHTIRHFETLAIRFRESVPNPSLQIAPLLLINLVENAFKHGVETMEKDAFIDLEISSTGNVVNFVVENNFESDGSHSKGIGLENLKRRLSLVYPEKHEFKTTVLNNVYRVSLSIQLEE